MYRNNIAVFAGSFDPIHQGHMDIIRRAKKDFSELIIVVAKNPDKKYVTSFAKRFDRVVKDLKNEDVRIIGLEKGLLVNLTKELGAKVLVRGYRTREEFKNEKEMAQINFAINPDISVVFYKSKRKYRKLSSTSIKK